MNFKRKPVAILISVSMVGVSPVVFSSVNAGDVRKDTTVDGIILGSDNYQYIYKTVEAMTVLAAEGGKVYRYETSFNTAINDGVQDVNGVDNGTVINNGEVQNVNYGDIVNDSVINRGGVQNINSGGASFGAVINGGGEQNIKEGGVASNSFVTGTGAYKGFQYIYDGGLASGTEVNGGGARQIVENGGHAVDTVLINGNTSLSLATNYAGSSANQYITNGGKASNTDIYNNSEQYIEKGGYAEKTNLLEERSYQRVQGLAHHTNIYGGIQYIEPGGEAYFTNLYGGAARQFVIGIADTTTINSVGLAQIVNDGGVAYRTTINNGIQRINYGGKAIDTVINSGGVQQVGIGSTWKSSEVEDTIINSGGLQIVNKNAVTINTTINGGQSWLYTDALASGKTEVNTTGELIMEAGSRATDVTINGGTLSVTDLTDETTSYSPAQVDKLAMDGGNVSFLRDSDGDFAALNISELSGNGNFLFNTSLAERNSNFVTIEHGTGNFGIAVTDSGKEISDHDDLTVNLIHDQGGEVDFSMVTANGRSTRAIDGGTYMYTLYSDQDKDGLNGGNVWYLGAMNDGGTDPGDGGGNGGTDPGDGGGNGGTDPGDGGNGNGNEGGNNGGGKPVTTPATDAILSMSAAGLSVINAELDGLRAYRSTLGKSGPENNVWGHYLGTDSRVNTSNGAAYNLQQNGMEIGADTRTEFSGGNLVTGAFMSYSDNRVKHARGGTSKIDSYGLGVYATWFDNSGFYADGVLKGNRLNSKLSAVMTNGGKTSGDWHQYGISSALEGGYALDVTENLSLTPYGRFTLAQISNEEVKLSNGMKGNTGTPRSVTGEAGARVATQFAVGNTEFRPYLSAAVVQEFAGSGDVTINSRNHFDNNQKGTSGKYGLGASVNVAKDAVIYGEMNYRQGSHIETPVQGMAGIRIGF